MAKITKKARVKQDMKKFAPDSPEYVVYHALLRGMRGKKVSCTYGDIRNPRAALNQAMRDIWNNIVEVGWADTD